MGNPIGVVILLTQYISRIDSDEIDFLKKKDDQIIIRNLVEKLLNHYQTASDRKVEAEQHGDERDLNEFLDWFEMHRIGTELWSNLARYALNDIDPGSKGNSKLFEFLGAATKFEDLLYGMDIYYRDHTIHSLWVYFIGEYLLRGSLHQLADNLNWYLFNDIEIYGQRYNYPQKLMEFAEEKENTLNASANKKKDATWCIIALCHDLGYSLAKLDRLNETVRGVVHYFDLPDIQHIGYSIDIEHQFLVSQFLELMAMDVRIVPSENYADEDIPLEQRTLIKCFRDDSTYWSLCRALERKQHGILSSYLIYKVLDVFSATSVRGAGETWGLEDDEAVANMIRGDILFAIAQHEFEFAHLDQVNSLADILVIADELEEFSRYGRQLVSRRYYDTMATSEIQFIPNNPRLEDDIEMEITYHVSKQRSLASFFQYKAERLCKIYSIGLQQDIENAKLGMIKSIKLIAKKDGHELYFHLKRDANSVIGKLPTTMLNQKMHKEGKHKVFCNDDKIWYKDSAGDVFQLKQWFESVRNIWWKEDQNIGDQ